MTSPEELLAAAHAACYAMAFSGVLARAGTPATSLDVTATATFSPKDGGGWHVSAMELAVEGAVPESMPRLSRSSPREGEAGCPISNALRGNVDIRVEPRLAS
jgi:osmotically inducible protein OsmC